MPTSTADTFLCQQALVILILPLAAFVIQVFLGKAIPPRSRQGDWIPTLAMFLGLCIATWMLVRHLLLNPNGIEPQRWYPLQGREWLHSIEGGATTAGIFRMDFGILVDNLTIAMLFVVTLVSFLVHLYSWGYMHGEKRYNYFFAYLALFSFSMLGLCITSNLLFLFIFWELVGVCSYFLIGFYFEKKSASNAAIKAFLTTRVGDLGFFLAILIIASVSKSQAGGMSLEFDDIFRSVQENRWAGAAAGVGLIAAAICLFGGPVGKSAQFPLHIWLPDAMEGPTPVSALIHAATMVAAGVYLVGRMFPFMAGPGYFAGDFYSSTPLLVVAVVGGFTAIFAASIAFSQSDIKKVLAYSTVSQLGYMMLGLGVGSVAAGLFHLTTHAMFKALLFLGSGSVIHAVHSNEMQDMGGLWKKMKITWATFLIGTLAIAGLPIFSGFFSKEAILTQAMAVAKHKGSFIYWLPFILGMATALMTAFYMFRLFFKTFHGAPRNHHAYEHAHESPWTMWVPLVALAALSVVIGGFWGGSEKWFEHRVSSEHLVPFEPTPVVAEVAAMHDEAHGTVLGLSLLFFVLGVGGAWLCFGPYGPLATRDLLRQGSLSGTILRPLDHCLRNLWFVDALLVRSTLGLVHFLKNFSEIFDRVVIDGLVNLQGYLCRFLAWVVRIADDEGVDGAVRGLGEATLRGGRAMRRLQTGNIQEYVYASVFLAAGVLGVSGLIIWLVS